MKAIFNKILKKESQKSRKSSLRQIPAWPKADLMKRFCQILLI